MAKVKIVSDNYFEYPIEEYVKELVDIARDIFSRQEIMYRVPFKELDDISFELDEFPDESIEVFNQKYSYVQSHYSRVSFILMQVKKELKFWSEYKGRLKSLYRKAKNKLLIENPEIKMLRNKEMQDAALQNQLDSLMDLMESIDTVIDSLKYDVDIVSIKLDSLDKANVNLNRQQKVVEDEMALNGIIGVRGVQVRMRNN